MQKRHIKGLSSEEVMVRENTKPLIQSDWIANAVHKLSPLVHDIIIFSMRLLPACPGAGWCCSLILCTLKTPKGPCPDQQRVSGVGKLCVATPRFQTPGRHAAGDTQVPYGTNREIHPSQNQFSYPETKSSP